MSRSSERTIRLHGMLWLAAFAALAGCDRGAGPGPGAPSEPPWFADVTAAAGLDFQQRSGAAGAWHMPEIMGSGVALFDCDGDGDLDLYLTNGNDVLPDTRQADSPSNRLFVQTPDHRFEDATRGSGLADGGYGMGVAVGDVDNDGRPDVYVTNYGPDHLYRNRGACRFEDITAAAGVDVPAWSASAAFGDYDLDGDLDLYVTQYVRFSERKRCTDDTGRPEYCGPKEYAPLPDVLLENDGRGGFTDVSVRAGIAEVRAAGLGVVWDDFDDDGLPDIYVANDAYANQLWINRGDGTFGDQAMLLGVAFNHHGQAEAGMGVLAADLDGDLHADLFMTHLDIESNTLYRNLGAERGFVDDSGSSGLGSSSMPFTGFGVVALDADLDGDLDLAVANGRVKHGKARPDSGLSAPLDHYAEPNLFYINDGAGHFEVLAAKLQGVLAHPEISRGLAAGDYDGDGDTDLVFTNIDGPARLLRNDAPGRGHWLAVRATDPALRRDAIGARVLVRSGGKSQLRSIHTGFSYQSSSEPVARFGLGASAAFESLEVVWPGGARERFPGGPADRLLHLVRGEGTTLP